MTGLHPQSPRHFACQPSAQVSQTLPSCYFCHMTAACKQTNTGTSIALTAETYWHLHRSDCWNILAPPSLWLLKHTHPSAQDFGPSTNFWQKPRPANYLRLKLESLWNYSCYTLLGLQVNTCKQPHKSMCTSAFTAVVTVGCSDILFRSPILFPFTKWNSSVSYVNLCGLNPPSTLKDLRCILLFPFQQ